MQLLFVQRYSSCAALQLVVVRHSTPPRARRKVARSLGGGGVQSYREVARSALRVFAIQNPIICVHSAAPRPNLLGRSFAQTFYNFLQSWYTSKVCTTLLQNLYKTLYKLWYNYCTGKQILHFICCLRSKLQFCSMLQSPSSPGMM